MRDHTFSILHLYYRGERRERATGLYPFMCVAVFPNTVAIPYHKTRQQSEVEETIERIKVQQGVENYVICNKQGQVLRRFPTMSQEEAEKYARCMISLATQAGGVVRDLDPKNELRYLRVRARRHEIMVAYDAQFIVIVTQKWTHSVERTG